MARGSGLVAAAVALANYDAVAVLPDCECVFFATCLAGVVAAWLVAGWYVAVWVELGVHGVPFGRGFGLVPSTSNFILPVVIVIMQIE